MLDTLTWISLTAVAFFVARYYYLWHKGSLIALDFTRPGAERHPILRSIEVSINSANTSATVYGLFALVFCLVQGFSAGYWLPLLVLIGIVISAFVLSKII
ncbi:MAG: hypothetical protein K2W82_14165 [Candidatus Obscuribacterales bacterium]|nr:hypothetical protein [Candidatus Obscuribacterales bacterium]